MVTLPFLSRSSYSNSCCEHWVMSFLYHWQLSWLHSMWVSLLQGPVWMLLATSLKASPWLFATLQQSVHNSAWWHFSWPVNLTLLVLTVSHSGSIFFLVHHWSHDHIKKFPVWCTDTSGGIRTSGMRWMFTELFQVSHVLWLELDWTCKDGAQLGVNSALWTAP